MTLALLISRMGAPPAPSTFHTVRADGRAPEICVEVDFTNDPGYWGRTWSDVTTDVRSISFTRCGRNNELQRSEAGVLSMLLDNRDGDYDPSNTAGTYYPGVKRMRWVRVNASYAGTVYPRWTGLIESWKQQWPGLGADATVEVSATDVFKPLNLFDLEGLTFPAQSTGERVAAVMSAADIAEFTVEHGQSDLPAVGTALPEGSAGLSHLLDVEQSENGLLFVNAEGKVEFQARHHRILEEGESQALIGDLPVGAGGPYGAGAYGAGVYSGAEIPYQQAEYDLDDADIWNVVSVTAGGTVQVVRDEDSIGAHFERRLSRDLLIDDVNEALDAANYLVGRYADPGPRVPTLDLLGALNPSQWPTILSLGNSDRVTWRRRANQGTIEGDFFVERVRDTIVPGSDWRVGLELSPVNDQAGWVLGDTVYGLLDETARLVY